MAHMSFEDQIRAVREASVLVALHGAALSHLLWMHPNSRVIELTPKSTLVRVHFRKFAEAVGRDFVRVGSSIPTSGMIKSSVAETVISKDVDFLRILKAKSSVEMPCGLGKWGFRLLEMVVSFDLLFLFIVGLNTTSNYIHNYTHACIQDYSCTTSQFVIIYTSLQVLVYILQI